MINGKPGANFKTMDIYKYNGEYRERLGMIADPYLYEDTAMHPYLLYIHTFCASIPSIIYYLYPYYGVYKTARYSLSLSPLAHIHLPSFLVVIMVCILLSSL